MKNKYILRIISGKYRGKGIESPADFKVRPTSARVKDSLFNIIRTELFGCYFLDLFAGTGQVGLEAISNGAKVTFVDINTDLVNKNIALLGCADEARVLKGDFVNIALGLAKSKQRFDFVFADPPYNEGLYQSIIESCQGLLKDDGLLILEHASDFKLECDLHGLEIKKERIYGSRTLTFLGGK